MFVCKLGYSPGAQIEVGGFPTEEILEQLTQNSNPKDT